MSDTRQPLHGGTLYDAGEYLIAWPANQTEWWEHLGDAHRDYAALARAAEALRIALQDVQGIALNGAEVGDTEADRLFAIDLRVTEALG